MVFRISKHVFVHIGAVLLIIFSVFSSAGVYFRAWLFFAAIHESCHAIVALLLGVPLRRLTILPYGFSLRIGQGSFCKEVAISLSGPVCSLFLSLLCRNPIYKKINLLLFLINLIPALPLDGGRFLRLVFWKTRGVYHGNRYMYKIGTFCGLLFLFASICCQSLSAAYIGWILLANKKNAPTHPIVQRKSVPGEKIKVFSIQNCDRLLPLTHKYSPFYQSVFFIQDRDLYISEQLVTACLRENAAASIEDVLACSFTKDSHLHAK